jgi:ketosteroid isomerase-like protein
MKYLFLFITTITFAQSPKESINQLLDHWHKAAATANFNAYFEVMDDESVFIGTDATENWNKKAFQEFSKPYFDRGKAWNFTSLERNIYFTPDGKTAWFDELLNTQMKICRGSGVLQLTAQGWKIKHYVLSMTIPNETTDAVIKIKSPIENPILDTLSLKKE